MEAGLSRNIRQKCLRMYSEPFDKKMFRFRQKWFDENWFGKAVRQKSFPIRQIVRQNRSTKILFIFDKIFRQNIGATNHSFSCMFWIFVESSRSHGVPNVVRKRFLSIGSAVPKSLPKIANRNIFVEIAGSYIFCRSLWVGCCALVGWLVGWQVGRNSGWFGSLVTTPDNGIVYLK